LEVTPEQELILRAIERVERYPVAMTTLATVGTTVIVFMHENGWLGIAKAAWPVHNGSIIEPISTQEAERLVRYGLSGAAPI
jgi:hypothetical protein